MATPQFPSRPVSPVFPTRVPTPRPSSSDPPHAPGDGCVKRCHGAFRCPEGSINPGECPNRLFARKWQQIDDVQFLSKLGVDRSDAEAIASIAARDTNLDTVIE